MKRYSATVFLLILILLIFSGPAFSQGPQGIPSLSLKEREFNFGNVKEGDHIEHAFTVQNKGTAVLEIKKVSPG